MEPAVDGCTVSSPDILGMAAAATVEKGEEGGACVKGVEPEVKGEGLGVGCVCCCCCCWDTAVIRGEGEVIGKGGEPTDETPIKRERERERERERKSKRERAREKEIERVKSVSSKGKLSYVACQSQAMESLLYLCWS